MTTFFTPDYLPLKKHCDTHQKTTSAIQNVVYNKLVKFSCVATFAIVTIVSIFHELKGIWGNMCIIVIGTNSSLHHTVIRDRKYYWLGFARDLLSIDRSA